MKITLKTLISLLPAYIAIALLLTASVFAVNREHLFEAQFPVRHRPFAAVGPNPVFAADRPETEVNTGHRMETNILPPPSRTSPLPANPLQIQNRKEPVSPENPGSGVTGAEKVSPGLTAASPEAPQPQHKEEPAVAHRNN